MSLTFERVTNTLIPISEDSTLDLIISVASWSDKPETKVQEDKEHLDTTKYKLFVDSVSSILSGMGESEMSSDLQTKSNACINSAKKMKKEEAIKSIESCFNGLMQAIYNKFTPQKAQQLQKNIRDMNCKDNEPEISCRKRVHDGWWN